MAAVAPQLGPHLARSAGFDILETGLARDLRGALRTAIRGGAVLGEATTPLGVFRHALATAIGRIEGERRAALFLRFIGDGPYEGAGDIPPSLQGRRLTDTETAVVIAFIYGHMVNCFKGALAEMLALAPCLRKCK